MPFSFCNRGDKSIRPSRRPFCLDRVDAFESIVRHETETEVEFYDAAEVGLVDLAAIDQVAAEAG